MTLSERAKLIAEKANECCYRSDGWEVHVYEFALQQLLEVRKEEQNVRDSV